MYGTMNTIVLYKATQLWTNACSWKDKSELSLTMANMIFTIYSKCLKVKKCLFEKWLLWTVFVYCCSVFEASLSFLFFYIYLFICLFILHPDPSLFSSQPNPYRPLFSPFNTLFLHFWLGNSRSPTSVNKTWHIKLL